MTGPIGTVVIVALCFLCGTALILFGHGDPTAVAMATGMLMAGVAFVNRTLEQVKKTATEAKDIARKNQESLETTQTMLRESLGRKPGQ
jgi:Kef-type K+ transport system membrane component KefB